VPGRRRRRLRPALRAVPVPAGGAARQPEGHLARPGAAHRGARRRRVRVHGWPGRQARSPARRHRPCRRPRRCGWVLVLVVDSGTDVSLWALAPALFVIGVGIGLSFATIPVVALGDAKPDEAGSASGSFSSIQQLASAIGSAGVTSIFFQAATSGLAHAMEVTLIVVLAATALSLPIVALMPRKAPSDPQQ
jgi:hypothetical protein